MRLADFKRSLASDGEVAALTAEIRDDLERAIGELRDLARGIYPPLLEHDGLVAALREAALRSAIPTQVRCERSVRHGPELEAAVYFCCLEALQNAAKHAGDGARTTVDLVERDGVLSFEVADDGAGFDPDTASVNAGLQNMTDRIGALGGELRIESAPGRGTKVGGAVPVRR